MSKFMIVNSAKLWRVYKYEYVLSLIADYMTSQIKDSKKSQTGIKYFQNTHKLKTGTEYKNKQNGKIK